MGKIRQTTWSSAHTSWCSDGSVGILIDNGLPHCVSNDRHRLLLNGLELKPRSYPAPTSNSELRKLWRTTAISIWCVKAPDHYILIVIKMMETNFNPHSLPRVRNESNPVLSVYKSRVLTRTAHKQNWRLFSFTSRYSLRYPTAFQTQPQTLSMAQQQTLNPTVCRR